MSDTVLQVRDLRVEFGPRRPAVRGVDLTLRRGEVLGLVGESGAGKTLTALALLGLPPRGATVSGSVRLSGTELTGLPVRDLARLRGNRIAMVFQDPLAAFTPVHRIGDQLAEALRIHHRGMARQPARARARDLLAETGVPDPGRVARAYPHQLSGGLLQRAMIAMATANRPDVIVADEPTSALDVTVRTQVLAALERARAAADAALLLVTHDLGVVAHATDRVAVMYAGRIVETGPTDAVFAAPRMPYTAGLLAASPRLDHAHPLTRIPGTSPALDAVPPGCAFAPRCPSRTHACTERTPELSHEVRTSGARGTARPATDNLNPPLRSTPPTANGQDTPAPHEAACRHPPATTTNLFPTSPPPPPRTTKTPTTATALRITALRATYPPNRRRHVAVRDAHLTVRRSETVALVGESGAGKSTTLARVLALTAPEAGRIEVLGHDTAALTRADIRHLRGRIGFVPQHPAASLDPRMTVGAILAEPLEAQRTPRAEIAARLPELLAQVELEPGAADRHPHAFSGGQLQRIALARALAVRPDLLLLDEPVSALDVSLQAGILDLLRRLTSRPEGPACLVVSHDLPVVRQIARRVVVMHAGRTVESGTVDAVLGRPRHPYTRTLLSSVLLPEPGAARRVPEPLPPLAGVGPGAGCAFRSHCPVYRQLGSSERLLCDREVPPAEKDVLCHFPYADTETPLRGRETSKGHPSAH
ncbi:ABC transporter ATP-binding protein [Streptomyces kunmingensis]|uniref:ABC transporter ATP-binding protein n=1 Tax=Streptomyces kunmingensis TaxID=68225 RepID=A0ABU6CKR9_9ACTN|nr:ABC transporter ATP-binding protein [Streptomyces kunmingensis]MEB3964697.1 ABC transporter ATP-binding protein [Streptomyces kunmingensis]